MIIVMFFAVLANFLNFLLPIFRSFKDCNMKDNSDTVTNLCGFVVVRVITHFLPILFSLYMFWHEKQHKKPDYLKFSAVTLSLASWEYLDKNDINFKSTLVPNIN